LIRLITDNDRQQRNATVAGASDAAVTLFVASFFTASQVTIAAARDATFTGGKDRDLVRSQES